MKVEAAKHQEMISNAVCGVHNMGDADFPMSEKLLDLCRSRPESALDCHKTWTQYAETFADTPRIDEKKLDRPRKICPPGCCLVKPLEDIPRNLVRTANNLIKDMSRRCRISSGPKTGGLGLEYPQKNS